MIEKEVKYGPRKIGEKAFARQQAEKVLEGRQATKYGPRKGGPQLVHQEDPEPVKGTGDDGTENPFVKANGDRVPLGTLESILEEKPELLDLAVETEVAQGEPRVGAVELLVKLEQARPEGARESVINILQKA